MAEDAEPYSASVRTAGRLQGLLFVPSEHLSVGAASQGLSTSPDSARNQKERTMGIVSFVLPPPPNPATFTA